MAGWPASRRGYRGLAGPRPGVWWAGLTRMWGFGDTEVGLCVQGGLPVLVGTARLAGGMVRSGQPVMGPGLLVAVSVRRVRVSAAGFEVPGWLADSKSRRRR